MKALFYSTGELEQHLFENNVPKHLHVKYTETSLSAATVSMAESFNAVCIGFSDVAPAEVLEGLYKLGIRYMTIRASNNKSIDLDKANQLGMVVANVPFCPSELNPASSPDLLRYMIDVTWYTLACYGKDLSSGNELTTSGYLAQAAVYLR